ncbi:hypothetical protein BDV96DRAFT_602033 [Lophiotrema nucula]|uniref:Uncharacterized protein n=1 Tax=Lophiotrema nucula TaxID=690887 RepID=A0A6A5Z0U0_9PLEO|nr:hypothetical protein BDV96DRAFT_602033 [Lophiotrema nucula]
MASASTINDQSTLKDNEPYRAPLYGADDPDRIAGWYIIDLKPGHTIEKHSAAVGTDMKKYLKERLKSLYPDRVVYGATEVDDELLEKIRADEGVQKIYCDSEGGELE